MKKYINLFFTTLISSIAFFTADHVITSEEVMNGLKYSNFFTYNFHRIELNYESAYGIMPSIFFLLILFFYNKTNELVNKDDKRLNVLSTICGILFASMIVIGYSFIKTNSFDLIFFNKFQFIISLINAIGYFLLFKRAFIYIITKTKTEHNLKKVKKEISKYKNKLEKIMEKHPIICCFIIFILCWIPYIVIFYPGTMNADSLNEINQFYGVKEWTTGHPIIPTIIYGTFMRIGQAILNDNFGIFLNNICQIIIGGLIISYSINNIYNLSKNKTIRNILIIFFAIIPIWPIHLYTEVKDIYFSLGVLLYVNILMSFIAKRDRIHIKQWILFILALFMVYAFRNNGIYIILLTTLFLFVIKKRKNRNISIVISILVIIISYSSNQILMNTLNISKGSIREAMALPLQQTSRYIVTYDITEEEKKDIEKLIDIDVFKNNYKPETVDFVKLYFKDNVSNEDLLNYFKQWWNMFLKHPGVYVSATLNSTYGYFYPDRKEYKDGIAQFEIDTLNQNLMNLDLKMINKSQKYDIESFLYMVRNLPFIGLFFSCGLYNWILIIITLIFIYYKKMREILPLIPLYIVSLVCIASPVNAFVRYMLPTMISMPFLITWSYYVITKGKDKETIN